MYNTEWAKSKRALDCFFTFMAKIVRVLTNTGSFPVRKLFYFTAARHSIPDLQLLNYFLSVSQWALKLSFPIAQTSSYVTAPDQSKVVL